MQEEAQFVMEEIAPNVNNYEHWLRITTTIHNNSRRGPEILDVLEDHIARRLAGQPIETTTPASATQAEAKAGYRSAATRARHPRFTGEKSP